MNLIHFQGLNCYHDCLITLANFFGLDYISAFSHLWAEGNLRYDPICQVFLSRRLPETLESMGMVLAPPCVTKEEREIAWMNTPSSGYIIAGMDACQIPWTPLYQLLHGPHYFIVQKKPADPQLCFDPTYGFHDQTLTAQELAVHAFALIPIHTVEISTPYREESEALLTQAQEVVKVHSKTSRHFLAQANACIQEPGENALLPAKFADALLTGRYLYRHFLEQRKIPVESASLFFRKSYYEDWLAVKNGFYKAALLKGNRTPFDEACSRFVDLLDQETAFARQVLSERKSYGLHHQI